MHLQIEKIRPRFPTFSLRSFLPRRLPALRTLSRRRIQHAPGPENELPDSGIGREVRGGHGVGDRAYTLAQGDTFREYFENIKAGNFYLVARDLAAEMLTSETLAWLDAAFWNSGHDFGMGKRLITGIGRIDQGVRVVLRGELKHWPRLRTLIWGRIHLVSFTRIPAFVYVSTQRAAGRRVVREMRLAGAIT